MLNHSISASGVQCSYKMIVKIMSFFVSSTVIAIFIMIPSIDSQICMKRYVFTKLQTEWYDYTYMETYRGNCWYKCIKTRVRVQKQPREFERRVVENKKLCCAGYTRVDDGIDDDRITCQAICRPPCIHGNCTSPGQCVCYEGYEKIADVCLPVCPDGCQNGTCIEPNTCRCHIGYELVNASTCQPLCTEPCANGTCIAPDICQCLDGYRKSENNTCEPYCFFGCEHGSCIAPETCRCDPGWYLNEENVCAAICDRSCGNGTCIAPNLCECLPGYTLNENTFNNTEDICVPSCKNCEGTCVAPGKCDCGLPYTAKHIAAHGGDCDCFDNCSDANILCNRTICSILASSLPTTEIQTIMDDEATENNEEYNINYTYVTSSSLNTDGLETTVSVTLDSNDTVFYNHTYDKLEDDRTWFKSSWIYIILCVAVVAVLMIILLISKWKYMEVYFKGRSYVVEDSKDDTVSAQFANIQFSSIANSEDSKKYED